MKKRRVVGLLFAIISAVLFYHSCTAVGADASAAVVAHALGSTVTLTSAQTVALFGQTIPAAYLTSSGGQNSMVDCTMSYYATVSLSGSNSDFWADNHYYCPTGQTFEYRDAVLYSVEFPSDLSFQPTQIIFELKSAVDLSAVADIDTAFLCCAGSSPSFDLDSGFYGTFSNFYAHTSFGDFDAAHRGQQGTNNYNLYGTVTDQTLGARYPFVPVFDSFESASAASFGWAYLPIVGDWDNKLIIGIVCPKLSADWQYSGNTGAGSGQSSGGGSDSGGGSGSGSVDMAGVENRLDSVLEKLDSIIAEMQDDDESSGGGSGSSSADSITSFDSAPSDFDFDAAAAAVVPAYDMPFLAPSDTPSGGSGLALDSAAIIDADAVTVTQSELTNGISLWWWLLSQITSHLPVFSSLIMANLTISLAIYFLFRGD